MHTYCEPATETNNPKTVTREFKKNVCFSTEDNKKFFYVYCGYKRNRSCTYCCQSASDGKEIEKKRTVDVRRRVHSRERSVAGGRAAPPARRRPEGGGERENPPQLSGELAGGRLRPFLFLRPARFPIPTSQNRRTHTKRKEEEGGGLRREKRRRNKKGKK
jgi:hypothetical protein